MSYHGDIAAGSTIRRAFNTVDADRSLVTLAGSPTVAVYKDGGTTEGTTGVTLTVDFDGKVGLHLVVVDTSADGTFFSAGSDFTVVLTAGTAGGVSVARTAVLQFSIEHRTQLADVRKWNGSTVATPTVAGVPEVDLTHVNGAAASGSATVDANVIEIDGSSVAADRLSAQMLAFVTGSVNDAGATTTSFIGDAGLSATDDLYVGLLIVPSSGILAGIPRTVTNYVGSSKTFTVDVAWPSAPANATTFILIGKGGSPA